MPHRVFLSTTGTEPCAYEDFFVYPHSEDKHASPLILEKIFWYKHSTFGQNILIFMLILQKRF